MSTCHCVSEVSETVLRSQSVLNDEASLHSGKKRVQQVPRWRGSTLHAETKHSRNSYQDINVNKDWPKPGPRTTILSLITTKAMDNNPAYW